MSNKEEPRLKISPAADEAIAKLVELFSDPSVRSKAHLRCPIEGPDEFEVLFESIMDDQRGATNRDQHRRAARTFAQIKYAMLI
jgi:hypothetical protein